MDQRPHGVAPDRGPVVGVPGDHVDQQRSAFPVEAQHPGPHGRVEQFPRAVDQAHALGEDGLQAEQGSIRPVVPNVDGILPAAPQIQIAAQGGGRGDGDRIPGPAADLAPLQGRCQRHQQVQQIGIVGRADGPAGQGKPATRRLGVGRHVEAVPGQRVEGLEVESGVGSRHAQPVQNPADPPAVELKSGRSRPIFPVGCERPCPRPRARLHVEVGQDMARSLDDQFRGFFRMTRTLVRASGAPGNDEGEQQASGDSGRVHHAPAVEGTAPAESC